MFCFGRSRYLLPRRGCDGADRDAFQLYLVEQTSLYNLCVNMNFATICLTMVNHTLSIPFLVDVSRSHKGKPCKLAPKSFDILIVTYITGAQHYIPEPSLKPQVRERFEDGLKYLPLVKNYINHRCQGRGADHTPGLPGLLGGGGVGKGMA